MDLWSSFKSIEEKAKVWIHRSMRYILSNQTIVMESNASLTCLSLKHQFVCFLCINDRYFNALNAHSKKLTFRCLRGYVFLITNYFPSEMWAKANVSFKWQLQTVGRPVTKLWKIFQSNLQLSIRLYTSLISPFSLFFIY